jgi:hypothetical protein
MADHAKASEHSRNLCDLIVDRLREKGDIPVTHAKGECSIGRGPVFLYVYHQKDCLKIFLYCDISDLDSIRSITNNILNIEARKSLGSDWAKITPYFVKIKNPQEAELVSRVYEFLASKPRGFKSRQKNPLYVLPSEDGVSARDEGDKISIFVNRYERDSSNRSACIKIYGALCVVCGFDFGKKYGEIGAGFIHVHHLTPLFEAGRRHKVNPKKDLRPVCPNCHEMLHKRTPPFTIEELRKLIWT